MTRSLPENRPGGTRVMSRYCATCVFTSRSGMRPGPQFDALRREWDAHDIHPVCTYLARGGVPAGEVANVTDADDIVCHGFFREVFLRTGLGQMLRSAANQRGFEYVDPPA